METERDVAKKKREGEIERKFGQHQTNRCCFLSEGFSGSLWEAPPLLELWRRRAFPFAK